MKRIAYLIAGICALAAPAAADALLPESPFHAFTALTREVNAPHRAAGNYVLLQENAHEALVLRLHLIRHAARSIDFQTFIWSDDECARLLQFELEQAARRGVKVRVLVDYMGLSASFNPAPGPGAEPIEVKVYRPPLTLAKSILPHHVADSLLPRGTNQRMHLKTIVVDGAVGITGGRNVDNHYFNFSTSYNFRDRDAVLIGPAVATMAECFEQYWRFKKSVRREKILSILPTSPGTPEAPLTAEAVGIATLFAEADRQAGDSAYIGRTFINPLRRAEHVEFIYDEPGKKTRLPYLNPLGGGDVTETLRELFRQAQDEIIIQSPYVVVNKRSRRPFQRAQKKHPGLRVMVSTNSFGAADHLITYAANFRLRPQVIGRLGFEVYEYMPHPADRPVHLPNYDTLALWAEQAGERRAPFVSIHAKSYVIDGGHAFVGTPNLDPRSFYYNSECGVLIRDWQVAQSLKRTILRDMAPDNSWVIAQRTTPLGDLNLLLEGLSGISPVDIWPVRNTSSFELRPGMEPVHVDHPQFYEHYRDIGSFPGAEGLTVEHIITRFLKITGKVATPML
jgi:cardiolipin synthase C